MPATVRRSLGAVLALVAACVPGACTQAAGAARTEPAAASTAAAPGFELFVLGRAQDGGLPHVGCAKPCCILARRDGRIETPACLGVHDPATGRLLLVEATPAVEAQIAALHALAGVDPATRTGNPIDAVLLTHAHIGHYLGLAHFGREVAATRGLPVHATPRMADFLRTNGPWSQLVALGQLDVRPLQSGALDATLSCEPLPGLTVEALRVPHRDEFSDTVAFKLRGPRRTALFVPDVDRWDAEPGLLERLLDGVDVAYLDATFYDGRELPGRDLAEIPHPPMVDTMERLADRARRHPGSIRFIHLNHTNPAWSDPAIRAEIARRGFAIAEVGERVPL